MNKFKKNDFIQEITCGRNFEYILEDNSFLANTDYKVLLSQTNGVFVQCMKILRNGKTSLYYITEGYRTLNSFLENAEQDKLMVIIMNLFTDVLEVKNNGFLTCQLIDLSWDKIFIEPNTLKVKIVYLPIRVDSLESYTEFESELRSKVIKLLNYTIDVPNERLNRFALDLSDGTLSLGNVYNRFRSCIANDCFETGVICEQGIDNRIKLVAMNAPGELELLINQDNVLIGKKKELVDLVVSFNNMISRKHCRILREKGMFFICDEGSANGTYVNGIRLKKGQKLQIKKGDMIRLANSDFRIM